MANNRLLRFEFNAPVSLAKDSYYIFLFASEGEETALNFDLKRTDAVGADSYTWYRETSGSAYGNYIYHGLEFYVEGAASIPEASTAALLTPLIGAGLLMRHRLARSRR